MAVAKLKDGRWVVYYVNPSPPPKIKKEYFGRGPTAQALARKRDHELNLRRTRPRTKEEIQGPIFAELAAEYLEHRGFSENSKKHLEIRLVANILPAIGSIPAIKITSIDLDRYVQGRRESVKNSTIRREITDIKAILNWAVKRNPPLIPYNPIRDYSAPPPDDDVIFPPTLEEVTAIIKHSNDRLYRAIKLSWYTGLRPGAVELLSLTWSNVLWESRVIRIRSAHKGGPEQRDVPIHPDFFDELRSWWEKDGRGFGPIVHYHGKPIRKLQLQWERTLKKAGITRRLRPYDLRHFFVTKAIESGIDYKTLSEIVGSSPETLRRHYQHVSHHARQKAVAVMPTLDIKPESGKPKDDKEG